MADNASPMDTFVDAIVSRAEKIQIIINALWARLRCMPHTIHLAALKVRTNYFFLCPTLTDSQVA